MKRFEDVVICRCSIKRNIEHLLTTSYLLYFLPLRLKSQESFVKLIHFPERVFLYVRNHIPNENIFKYYIYIVVKNWLKKAWWHDKVWFWSKEFYDTNDQKSSTHIYGALISKYIKEVLKNNLGCYNRNIYFATEN